MSSAQQVTFKNWQFYVFFATTIFAAGGAWHRLNELSDAQVTSIIQREKMQESIFRLQEQLRALEQRLEAKKIVGMIADSEPLAKHPITHK